MDWLDDWFGNSSEVDSGSNTEYGGGTSEYTGGGYSYGSGNGNYYASPTGGWENVNPDLTNYNPDYSNNWSWFNTDNSSSNNSYSIPDYFGTGTSAASGGGTQPIYQPQDTSNPFGSISQTLSGLFNNPQALGLAGKGVAALFEGYQNKKKAAAMQQLAKNTALDPFGSQRQFYQQQAQQAVINPYDSPIVKAQIEQLQNAQNIKDAQAGRRSNMLTSSPAVMAEMAKIAQNYQQQMAVQGGANIAPSGGLAQILQSGSNADTNGYISPLLTAAGYGVQDNALANLTAEQKKLLGQQWANA